MGVGGRALEVPCASALGLSPQTCPSARMGFVAAGLSTILLDAVTDKDPLVQEQVCSALCALGESQPEGTLCACEEHLRQHEKVWDLGPLYHAGGGACGRGGGASGAWVLWGGVSGVCTVRLGARHWAGAAPCHPGTAPF